MIAMENKACGKEVGVALGWMIFSPTSSAVDFLDSWVARVVAPGMEVGGEERTWSIHSSKTKLGNGKAVYRVFLLSFPVFKISCIHVLILVGERFKSLVFIASQCGIPSVLCCILT